MDKNSENMPFVSIVVISKDRHDELEKAIDDIKEISNDDQNYSEMSGQIKGETEKALLILFTNGKEVWLPKSTIHSKYDSLQISTQKFLIDRWILEKNGLI